MKKFVIQVVILLIITFAALAFYTSKFPGFVFQPPPSATNLLKIKDLTIKVEIADSDSERQRGLSGRQALATDSGMLFIFPERKKYVFWMKGMSFPLDFVWIKDAKVADIIKNIPNPSQGQSDGELLRYAPNTEIDMLLEVNAGFVDKTGIKVGDPIELAR